MEREREREREEGKHGKQEDGGKPHDHGKEQSARETLNPQPSIAWRVHAETKIQKQNNTKNECLLCGVCAKT